MSDSCNMCGKDTGKPFYEVDNHAGDGIYNICLVCAGGALRTITRETIKQAAEIERLKKVVKTLVDAIAYDNKGLGVVDGELICSGPIMDIVIRYTVPNRPATAPGEQGGERGG